MTEFHYDIIEERYYLNDNTRVSYGIVAYAGAEPDNIAEVIVTVNDVSCDRQKLTELISICNDMSLSVIHLQDVVRDFLEE